MHSIQSSADKADFRLRKMSAENKSHVKYLSFKNNIRAEKIAGLYLNRLINRKHKYEWLNDIELLDNAKYNS